MTDNLQPTTAAEWKKSSAVQMTGAPLPLPSGNTALVRRPGLQTIIQTGLVPNSLISIISSAINGEKVNEAKLREEGMAMLSNPSMLGDYLEMVDRIVCFAVVEPSVQMPPTDPSERREDVLYADEVDMDDKQFIWQYVVGGTRDLEKFREESARGVEAVRSLQDVQGQA